ncbi:MAG TPA: hypothetical protein VF992_07915 [Thermoplasmata archaeon]
MRAESETAPASEGLEDEMQRAFAALDEEGEPTPDVPEDELNPASEVLDWRRFIRLAVGEYPLRNFYVARLWLPYRARANILVTNLRVLMYGVGGRGVLGRSRFVQEVHLDKVVGVESFLGWSFNLLMLGAGMVLLALGLLPYTNLIPAISHLATSRTNFLWYILILLGIMLIVLCFRHLFYVTVKTMALSSEIYVTARRGFGWSNSKSLQFGQKPGPDAHQLIRELGSVILDAQNGEATPQPALSYPLLIRPTETRLDRRGTTEGT